MSSAFSVPHAVSNVAATSAAQATTPVAAPQQSVSTTAPAGAAQYNPAEFVPQYSPQVYAVYLNGAYGVSNTILTAPPSYAQPPIGGAGPYEIPTLPPTFFAPSPGGPNQVIENLQRFASRALVNVAPARTKAA